MNATLLERRLVRTWVSVWFPWSMRAGIEDSGMCSMEPTSLAKLVGSMIVSYLKLVCKSCELLGVSGFDRCVALSSRPDGLLKSEAA